jgi:hypothetical protein
MEYSDQEESSSNTSTPARQVQDSPAQKQKKSKGKGKNPGSAQKKEEQKMENLSSGELTWNTLLPYKNHINGEKRFNESVRKHPDDPTPQWFVTTLKMVLNDETLRPRQEDPLGIVEAWQMMKDIQPNFFSDKKLLTVEQRRARDSLGQKFHSYLQLLRCADCVRIPVKIFCHMVCKSGCPPEYDGYNDRPFKDTNMNELESKLSGKHVESWNNMQNLSMHLMVKWTDEELKQIVAPDVAEAVWNSWNPKQIGAQVQKWLDGLDPDTFERQMEFQASLIPTAGKQMIILQIKECFSSFIHE